MGQPDPQGYGLGSSSAPLREFSRSIAPPGPPAQREALRAAYAKAAPLMSRLNAEWRFVDRALKSLDALPNGRRDGLAARIERARAAIQAAIGCDPAAVRQACDDLIAQVNALKAGPPIETFKAGAPIEPRKPNELDAALVRIKLASPQPPSVDPRS